MSGHSSPSISGWLIFFCLTCPYLALVNIASFTICLTNYIVRSDSLLPREPIIRLLVSDLLASDRCPQSASLTEALSNWQAWNNSAAFNFLIGSGNDAPKTAAVALEAIMVRRPADIARLAWLL